MLVETYRIRDGTEQEEAALGQVVRQPGLLGHLLEAEHVDAMDDGREARQPGHDEDDKAKYAPLRALKVRQHHNDDAEEAQGTAHAPINTLELVIAELSKSLTHVSRACRSNEARNCLRGK